MKTLFAFVIIQKYKLPFSLKKRFSHPASLYSLVLFVTSYTVCQAQPHTFPTPIAKAIPWNKPAPKTCKDFKLVGKVRLVEDSQTALGFDTLGRIIRKRETTPYSLKIIKYEYDMYGRLLNEDQEYYDNPSIASIGYPDKRTIWQYEYTKSGQLAMKRYITHLKEDFDKEEYRKTDYTYTQDSLLIGEKNTNVKEGAVTGWHLRLDPNKRWIRKYDLGPEKKLLETSYFDATGHLLQTFSHKGQDSLLIFQRADNNEGHTDSEYHYDENGKIRLEERTIWQGKYKHRVHYFRPDSLQVMQLVHAKVFNQQGEMIADSLYEEGIVQKYYFTSGKPDFLQINTAKNGKEVARYDRKYNGNGIMVYELHSTKNSKAEYKHDDLGNVTFFDDGSLILKTAYKYDTIGNWIEKKPFG